MKKNILWLLMAATIFFGCATRTQSGMLAGGVLGAEAGGLMCGAKGALIGGAVGVISGAMVGSALDEQDRRVVIRFAPSTIERMDRSEPITVIDVIKLSQGGVSDRSIIRYIRSTRTTYDLTRWQINRMKAAGVSRRVICYMINAGQ